MKCKLCSFESDNKRQFATHLQRKHRISSKEYTIKHILGGMPGLCPVCGEETRYVSFGFKKYCKNHASVAESEMGRIGGRAKKNSKKIKTILDFARTLGIETLNTKGLDIYSEKHKFGICYNDLSIKKEKNDNINKTLACLEQGIKVFHIFSDEWRDKQEIVKSMICHRLKKPKRTIFARKCELKVVPNKEGDAFFKTTHISGGVKSRKYFGLYFKGELVACLGFKKPIQKKYGECMEISRFSTALYTHIPGAFSKIFKMAKHYFKNEGYETILSYADRRFGEGKVYKVNGFEFLGCTPSLDYWYGNDINGDGGVRHWRFKFRAQPGKPERQVAEEAGVYKVFGCGSNIYLKTL
jgi:hypothetical protein